LASENVRLKAARALFAAIDGGKGGGLGSLWVKNAVQVAHPKRLKAKGSPFHRSHMTWQIATRLTDRPRTQLA